MDCELLAFCRAQAGISDEQHGEQQEGSICAGENAQNNGRSAHWGGMGLWQRLVAKNAEIEQQLMIAWQQSRSDKLK